MKIVILFVFLLFLISTAEAARFAKVTTPPTPKQLRLNGGVHKLPLSKNILKDADPDQLAFTALKTAFNVRNPSEEYRFVKQVNRVAGLGLSRKYQQYHNGIKVDGAVVNVNLGAAADHLELSGKHLYDIPASLSTIARMDISNSIDSADVEDIELVIYRKDLTRADAALQAAGDDDHLAWKVTSKTHIAYVDAHSGDLLANLSRRRSLLDRSIADAAGTEVRNEGDPPVGRQTINALYNATGEFYKLMLNVAGLDGYDNSGGTFRGIVDAPFNTPGCPQNAFSEGDTITICNGMDAPFDVIGHEWGHSYSSLVGPNLLYEFESGALEEGYADIFGETFELAYKTDWPVRVDFTCDSASPRWKLGNEIPLDQFDGPIRDMYNPACFQQPGSAGGEFTQCFPQGTVADDSNDQGGVHANSGIPNQLYSLLVDGGLYDNTTFAGIGLVKAFAIFVDTWLTHLTSSSTFLDLAAGLAASCNSLAQSATDLPDLLTGTASGQVVAAGDCAVLSNLITALRLSTPMCGNPVFNGTAELLSTEMYPSIGWDPIGIVPSTTIFFETVAVGFDLSDVNFVCVFSHQPSNMIATSISFSEARKMIAACDTPVASGNSAVSVRLVELNRNVSTAAFPFTFVPVPDFTALTPSSVPLAGGEVQLDGTGFAEYSNCWGFPISDFFGQDLYCNSVVFGELQENDYVAVTVLSTSAAKALVPPYTALQNVTETSVDVWYSDNTQIFINFGKLLYSDGSSSDSSCGGRLQSFIF